MSETQQYDAIVIGAGQAGGPLSTALAQTGRTVAIIEREHVGGTCVNVGCTPTKTMIASARAAYVARRGRDYGVGTGPITVDQTVVRERKRKIVREWNSGSEKAISEEPGVDLIFGEASFRDPKRLSVAKLDGETVELSADWIFINVGARPAVPTIDGIDTVPFLDSTSIMELGETPEHLIVLGGGYIGLEFGQMFRRFGSNVTIVHRGSHLIEREDDDIAEAMQEMLEGEGIEVLLRASATAVRADGDGIALEVTVGDGTRTITGSHLLVAAGRTLNSDRLNLSAAGVQTDKRGAIQVNERLETGVEGIWALGDVVGGPAFTHMSYDDFRIVRENLLHDGHRTTGDRPVPYVIFTDPELARIGLSEKEAKKQGVAYRTVRLNMTDAARAEETDEMRGFWKALIDPATDKVLGAAIFGMWGGEIMTQIQLAMMGGLTASQLKDTIFAHPTLGESVSVLFSRE